MKGAAVIKPPKLESDQAGNPENSILVQVEQQLQKMQQQIDTGTSSSNQLRVPSLDTHEFGVPMNDFDLQESMEWNNERTKDSATLNSMRLVFSRLSDVENRLPEFKGRNSWDVPIPKLKSDALLIEVIEKVNLLIQQSQRQDRLT